MEDRELLELAAKAAGIAGFSDEDCHGAYFCTPANRDIPRSEPTFYRWLADDGDALRLAAKLGLILCAEPRSVYAHTIKGLGIEAYASQGGPDHMSNIRRAIVRAAAEIGKSMP